MTLFTTDVFKTNKGTINNNDYCKKKKQEAKIKKIEDKQGKFTKKYGKNIEKKKTFEK